MTQRYEPTREELIDQILSLDLWARMTSQGMPVLTTLHIMQERVPRYSTAVGLLREELYKRDLMVCFPEFNPYTPRITPIITFSEQYAKRHVGLKESCSLLETELSLTDRNVEKVFKD